MKETASIYRFKNLVNGKVYIGQSWRPELRYREHVTFNKSSSNELLRKALEKYGIENFEYSIIHSGIESQRELDDIEIQEIKNHDCIAPKGYNIREGGFGGRIHQDSRKKISDSLKGLKQSEETKLKRSESLKRTYSNPEIRKKLSRPGRVVSEETRRKIGQSHIGKKISDEAKKKMRDAKIGMVISEETRMKISKALKGKVVSKETRIKLVLAQKNRKPISEETREKMSMKRRKPVMCIETGEVFESGISASQKLGLSMGMVNCAISTGGRAGGFHWRHVDE